jgi:hypothetical protein
MAAGGDLPHDLYTFVIEDALGLEYGFWGCVASGATFKTLGRKRTPQGKAVIARHRHDLEAAEARVNEIYFAWRSGGPTVLDDELDSMLTRWRALTESDELTLRWPARRSTTARTDSAFDAMGTGHVTHGGESMAELSAKKREKLPAKDFGLPEKARTKDAKKDSGNYPMPDKAHARNAKARAAQQRKAGNLTKAEQERIDRKADKKLES